MVVRARIKAPDENEDETGSERGCVDVADTVDNEPEAADNSSAASQALKEHEAAMAAAEALIEAKKYGFAKPNQMEEHPVSWNPAPLQAATAMQYTSGAVENQTETKTRASGIPRCTVGQELKSLKELAQLRTDNADPG